MSHDQTENIQKKDYSISAARLVAMCFIVACHIMQRDDFASNINGAHIGWAFWFNIGVQMFLFISGLLYGRKRKIAITDFYKKSFPKLLIEYYVFVFVMLVVIHFSPLIEISDEEVIGLLTFSGYASGIEHLWFIPLILFCYLLVPIFSDVLNALDERSDLRFWIESILLLFLVHKVTERLFKFFAPAWINCFLIGMIYSRIEARGKNSRYAFNIIVSLLCLLIIPLQFRLDYWPHRELPLFFLKRYGYFTNYGHVCLGIITVVFIRFLYNKKSSTSTRHYILNWSDRYSYSVYLVHHVFIQSALGCVEFITNRLIAIPLAILLSIVSAVVLYNVSEVIRKTGIMLIKRIPN